MKVGGGNTLIGALDVYSSVCRSYPGRYCWKNTELLKITVAIRMLKYVSYANNRLWHVYCTIMKSTGTDGKKGSTLSGLIRSRYS